MDNKLFYQPELPFEHKASGPPESIANDPESLEAWERGHQRAVHILGEGKNEQQLPLPRSTQAEESSVENVLEPIDRESLRRVARLAVFNQLINEGFISINPMSNAPKPKAVLGSAAKIKHPPKSREDLERGVKIEKDDNYGNQGRSPEGAAQLKLADQIARRKDNRR